MLPFLFFFLFCFISLLFPLRTQPNQPPNSALRWRGVELCLLMNPLQQPSPYGHPPAGPASAPLPSARLSPALQPSPARPGRHALPRRPPPLPAALPAPVPPPRALCPAPRPVPRQPPLPFHCIPRFPLWQRHCSRRASFPLAKNNNSK